MNTASETLWTFTLGQDYSTPVDGDIIIGYVDTLATERWVEGKGYATTAQLAEKRGMLDMSVRGAPTGAGSFFTVNQEGTVYTYTYANGIWSASETMAIRLESGEYIQYNPEMGEDHFSFTLTLENNYSYTDTDSGFVVVGYADTLATEDWVEGKNYATTTYAVKNDGGVAKVKSMTQAAYDALVSPDATTLYVIPEEV